MELVWKPSEQLMATLNAFVSLYGYEQVSGAIFKNLTAPPAGLQPEPKTKKK